MQFTISIIALAASASALVIRDDSYSAPPMESTSSVTCAEGSQVSCCTTTSGNSGVLGNVLGGSCLLDQVSLLSALDNMCPAANTFCCPSKQDGTLNINLSCIPVNA